MAAAAIAVALAVLAVASVSPLSMAHPGKSWGAFRPGSSWGSFFKQYALALGESVTIQSAGFPNSSPASARNSWNVLCLPTENTTLVISCYVDIEHTPLCFKTSLTIKSDDEDRMLCGKDYFEDFVSSTGFARFEFSSKSKGEGQGFICQATCQAPEEVVEVSPTTPGPGATTVTEALEGEGEESGDVEAVTDTGAEDLETVTDGAGDLETVTDGAGDLETATDGDEDLETVTDGAEFLETATDGAGDLETETDGGDDLETVTDGAGDLETETDGGDDLETVTDGAGDLETATDGDEDMETVTDGAEFLETATDDAEDLETVTDGGEDLETTTDGAVFEFP